MDRTALESLYVQRHDILLLDLGLPGKDGMEALRQIRAQQNPISLFMLAVVGKWRFTERASAYPSPPERGEPGFLAVATHAGELCQCRPFRNGSRRGDLLTRTRCSPLFTCRHRCS